MKQILIGVCSVALALTANALSLTGKRLANNAKFENDANIWVSARSSSTEASSTYEIIVNRSQSDKGDFKVYAMTYVFVTTADGGTKSDKMYAWIPSSVKELAIGEEVGKFILKYTTPTMKFDKEKWVYFGDFSKGAKLNGVLVCICDMSTPNKNIVRVFKTCTGKPPKNGLEIERIASDSKVNEMIERLDFFNMDSCSFEKE